MFNKIEIAEIKKRAEQRVIVQAFKNAVIKAKENGIPFELAENRFNSTYDTQESKTVMMQDFIYMIDTLINDIETDNRVKLIEANNHEYSIVNKNVLFHDYNSSGKMRLVNFSDMRIKKIYEFLGY